MKVGGTISVISSYPSSGCLRILKLEVYMNIRRHTVLDLHEPYRFSRTDFITSTSSLLHSGFPFYGWSWCEIFFNAIRGLRLPSVGHSIDCRNLMESMWHLLSPIWPVYSHSGGCALESAALNQWPRG